MIEVMKQAFCNVLKTPNSVAEPTPPAYPASG